MLSFLFLFFLFVFVLIDDALGNTKMKFADRRSEAIGLTGHAEQYGAGRRGFLLVLTSYFQSLLRLAPLHERAFHPRRLL